MNRDTMTPKQLANVERHGELILLGLTGSHAFGLATPQSDFDWKGIFQAPTTTVLCHAEKAHVTGHNPDHQIFELDKVIDLALMCNPTMLELMNLDEYEVLTPAGQRILDYRQDFLWTKAVQGAFVQRVRGMLSKLRARDLPVEEKGGVLHAYKGSANSQLKGLRQIIAGKDNSVSRRQKKHIRHIFRSLDQARTILATGEVVVRVPDPERLFELGRLDPERAIELAEKEMAEIAKIKSVLPSKPNREAIDQLRLELRLQQLGIGR